MKEAVLIFREWVDAAEALPSDGARGRLFHAVCRYSLDGVEPKLTGQLRAAFELMRAGIDLSRKRRKAQENSVLQRRQNRLQNDCKTIANELQNDCKTIANKLQSEFCNTVCNSQRQKEGSSPLDPSSQEREKYIPTHTTGAHVRVGDGETGKNAYPQTVEDVMAIAALPQCGARITEEEARAYLVCRMASDWTDAAGRRITPGRLVWDLKKWEMKSNERKPAKSRVDYSDPSTWSSLNGGSGK